MLLTKNSFVMRMCSNYIAKESWWATSAYSRVTDRHLPRTQASLNGWHYIKYKLRASSLRAPGYEPDRHKSNEITTHIVRGPSCSLIGTKRIGKRTRTSAKSRLLLNLSPRYWFPSTKSTLTQNIKLLSLLTIRISSQQTNVFLCFTV